jgi:hypothetical protein
VLDTLFGHTFGAPPAGAYEREIQRAVQRIVIDELMDLAGGAAMSQVRAVASYKLKGKGDELAAMGAARGGDESAAAHAMNLADDIRRFLERPVSPVAQRTAAPAAPPGAPIGDRPLNWLDWFEPDCSHLIHWH